MNKKIYELLKYTKTSNSQYQGTCWDTGYHTITVDNIIYEGQRKPSERLQNIPYDFKNKSVLDIGCNQGGMLFELKDKIANGVGVDYDYKLINCANKIKSYQNLNHLNFFVHDAEKDPFKNLNYYNNGTNYDIIFLLSVCMWITNWKELCVWCAENAKVCLFETNGKKHQQQEQVEVLQTLYRNVTLIRDKSTDDKIQSNRKLYYCEN